MEYGLIGEKLSHSYSKIIHELFGSYAYELKEIGQPDLRDFLLSRDFCGINVTIPYKQAVIPYLDEIDPKAERIGAVNTIVNRDGKLTGYNTDYFGLRSLVKRNGYVFRDKKVIILGSGGTSKTAFSVAEDLGASPLIVSRNPSGANAVSYEEAYRLHADADHIINTTPLGMYPDMDNAPADLKNFHNLQSVTDVIYNPLRTKLTLQAKELGIPAVNGLLMLILQAVEACRLFTGMTVKEERIEEIFQTLKSEKENIVLTGMPGCGKSTVGKLLAKRLQMDFVDTDAEIVKKAGKSIPEIFADEGETAFRDLESAVTKEVSGRNRTVIATGGGLILRNENVTSLKNYGKLVFLDRKIETIRATADRPLSDDRTKLLKLYEERLPKYMASADLMVSVADSPKQTADRIMELLERQGN